MIQKAVLPQMPNSCIKPHLLQGELGFLSFNQILCFWTTLRFFHPFFSFLVAIFCLDSHAISYFFTLFNTEAECIKQIKGIQALQQAQQFYSRIWTLGCFHWILSCQSFLIKVSRVSLQYSHNVRYSIIQNNERAKSCWLGWWFIQGERVENYFC